MEDIYNKIIMEFQETREDFIFTTIYAYCCECIEQKISKERLRKLLMLGLIKEKELNQ